MAKGGKIQKPLSFKSNRNHFQTETCKECGMSYYKYIKKDQELHNSYHKTYTNGLLWTYISKVLTEQTITNSKRYQLQIMCINKDSESQVRRVREVLKMVNLELNASEGSDSWSQKPHPSSEQANSIEPSAFLAVIDHKAVGICTTEAIEGQGRWMVYSTQTIVPGQVNRRVKVGISRIWVAPRWRRQGIAKMLLQVVMNHSVYGVRMERGEIGFSQPSTRGGILARGFNGVKHKSGEELVPVYDEVTTGQT